MQNLFRVCSVPSGAEVDESLWTRVEGHKKVRGNMLNMVLNLEEGELPDREAQGWLRTI